MEALRPRVLLAGGFEPSGRVGLWVDVAAARDRGAEPVALPTALTVQGKSAFRVQRVGAPFFAAQLQAAVERGGLGAVKVGLVPDARTLQTLQAERRLRRLWWVADPVVRNSEGRRLSTLRPRDYLALAGPRVVLTPNALEAGWLLGEVAPEDEEGAARAAEALRAYGFGAVVVKGGHLRGAPVDVVAWRGGLGRLRRRVRGMTRLRGTGCRFATVMAVALARGVSVPEAAKEAHRYLGKLFRAASST